MTKRVNGTHPAFSRSGAACTFAALLAAAPFGAAAQDSGRGLDISLSLNSVYDTNVARTSDDTALARGLDKSDFRLAPTVTVAGALPIGRNSVQLTASAAYDFYTKNTQLNRERLSFDGVASLSLPVCDPTISAGFSRRQSDLGDILLLPGAVGSIEDLKNVETTKTAGLTLACFGNAAIGFRPTASVVYSEGRNDNSLRSRNNFDTLTYSGGLAYNHPTIGKVNLFVRRSEVDFPRQGALIVDNGYTVTGYGVGYQRALGSRLSTNLELSYSNLKPLNPATPEFNGLNWSGDLRLQVSERLQLRAQLSRSLDSALAFDTNYFVNRSMLFDANFALTDRINVLVAQNFRNRGFKGGAQSAGLIPDKDQQASTFGKITYRRSDRMSFSLNGGYYTRKSDGNLFDYNSAQIGVGIDYRF